MNKVTSVIILTIVSSSLFSCSAINKNKEENVTQWDFDHHVQFIQSKLSKNNYQLEVIPNNNVRFEKLATFLLRKSYNLCRSYHFNIEMIQGIEGFDDKRAMPNYIQPSLIAKVECKLELNKEKS
jgi:hypothetical protein